MSLTAFLQQYVKPSRWWRRQRTIQITVWPKWLAQFLCTHAKTQDIAWDIALRAKTVMCLDCHKQILVRIDCEHGEVQPHVMETVNVGQGRRSAQMVVRSYMCLHCGLELEPRELPPGCHISHGGQESLWRD